MLSTDFDSFPYLRVAEPPEKVYARRRRRYLIEHLKDDPARAKAIKKRRAKNRRARRARTNANKKR